jgi:hypothetical protein
MFERWGFDPLLAVAASIEHQAGGFDDALPVMTVAAMRSMGSSGSGSNDASHTRAECRDTLESETFSASSYDEELGPEDEFTTINMARPSEVSLVNALRVSQDVNTCFAFLEDRGVAATQLSEARVVTALQTSRVIGGLLPDMTSELEVHSQDLAIDNATGEPKVSSDDASGLNAAPSGLWDGVRRGLMESCMSADGITMSVGRAAIEVRDGGTVIRLTVEKDGERGEENAVAVRGKDRVVVPGLFSERHVGKQVYPSGALGSCLRVGSEVEGDGVGGVARAESRSLKSRSGGVARIGENCSVGEANGGDGKLSSRPFEVGSSTDSANVIPSVGSCVNARVGEARGDSYCTFRQPLSTSEQAEVSPASAAVDGSVGESGQDNNESAVNDFLTRHAIGLSDKAIDICGQVLENELNRADQRSEPGSPDIEVGWMDSETGHLLLPGGREIPVRRPANSIGAAAFDRSRVAHERAAAEADMLKARRLLRLSNARARILSMSHSHGERISPVMPGARLAVNQRLKRAAGKGSSRERLSLLVAQRKSLEKLSDLNDYLSRNREAFATEGITDELDPTRRRNEKAFWFGEPETEEEKLARFDELAAKTRENLRGVSEATPEKVERLIGIFRRHLKILRTRLGNDLEAKLEPMKVTLRAGAPMKRMKMQSLREKHWDIMVQFGEELVNAGLCEPISSSRMASRLHCVPKPGGAPGELRGVQDYSFVNFWTEVLQGIMPDLEQELQWTQGMKFFLGVDFLKGFWQCPLHPESQELFAFMTPLGLLKPKRVPQGAADSATWFHNQLQKVYYKFRRNKSMLLWIDDLLLMAPTFDDYLEQVEEFLQMTEDHNLQLSFKKLDSFCDLKAKFCGREITQTGVKLQARNTEMFLKMAFPETAGELSTFLMGVNWMRGALMPNSAEEGFAPFSLPLWECMKRVYEKCGSNERRRYESVLLSEVGFGEAERAAFKKIQWMLATHCETMSMPAPGATVCLYSDASDFYSCAILTQVLEWDASKPHYEQAHLPLGCFSEAFKGSELNWRIIEKEAWPIVQALETWDYILGLNTGFNLYCDHKNIVHLFHPESVQPALKQSARIRVYNWLYLLSQYRINHFEWVKGEFNIWADLGSRWANPGYRDGAAAAGERYSVVKSVRLAAISCRKSGLIVPIAASDRPKRSSAGRTGPRFAEYQHEEMNKNKPKEKRRARKRKREQRGSLSAPPGRERELNEEEDASDSDEDEPSARRRRTADGSRPRKLEVPKSESRRFDGATTQLALNLQYDFGIPRASRVSVEIIGAAQATLTSAETEWLRKHRNLVGKEVGEDTFYRQVSGGQLWVPFDHTELVLRLVIAAHQGSPEDNGEPGHRGRDVVLAYLREYVWWSDMEGDVARYLKLCRLCNVNRDGKGLVPRPMGHQLHVKQPGEAVSVDYCKIAEVFTREEVRQLGFDLSEFQYMLVLRDLLSGFVELVPARSADAATFAEALLQWVARYVKPTWLVSDRGSHFTAEIVERLAKTLNVTHHFVHPYCPWANGAVEQANRTILPILRHVLRMQTVNTALWARVVPVVQLIVNQTPILGTAVSPKEAFLGFKRYNPLHYVFLPKEGGQGEHELELIANQDELADYLNSELNDMIKAREELRREAVNKLRDARAVVTSRNSRTMNGRDARKFRAKELGIPLKYVTDEMMLPDFEVGTFVMRAEARLDQVTKLEYKWRGPEMIVGRVSSHVYEVKSLVRERTREVHITRLKFYCDREIDMPVDLVKEIRQEDLTATEFIVEKFAGHRYNESEARYELFVRWKGFEELETSWEPLQVMLEDVTVRVKAYVEQLNPSDESKAALQRIVESYDRA